MRLYKLMSRHGQIKRRYWPWFDPPPPEAPRRYAGWVWDPGLGEWVAEPIPQITVEVEVPKYPRPLESPRAAQPINVPGWYWNGRVGQWEEIPLTPMELSEGVERGTKPTRPPGPAVPTEVEGWSWSEAGQEWVATIIFGQKIDFEPPPTLPPGVLVAGAPPIFPTDMQYIIIFRQLMDGGMTWEQANGWIDLMRQTWTELALAKQMPELIKYWSEVPAKVYHDVPPQQTWLGPTAQLILVAAGIGVLIGMVADRMITPDDPAGSLRETEGTYLLGPDEWLYSKNIGKSLGGRTYYSHCGSIGDAYVRHKRARGKDGYDIIDFPGGFVETGYQAPYFVKYRWSEWVLQYIGMLESSGERFYRLKECDYDRFATVLAGYSVKQSEWCKDFHYYL